MAIQIKDKQDHHVQQKINEDAFIEVLRTLNPELFVLNKLIAQEKLSPNVFSKLARQLININAGTRYGDIHIVIEDGIVKFINGTEKDRVFETISRKTPA